MAYGEPDWNWNQIITTTGSATTVPYYIVPAPVPEPEPQDDSPLVWLRSQVAEMCELARVA